MASTKILAILLAIATQAFYSHAMIPLSEFLTDQQNIQRNCQCQPQEGDIHPGDTAVRPKNNENYDGLAQNPGTGFSLNSGPADSPPYPYYRIPVPNIELTGFNLGSAFGESSFNHRSDFGGFSTFNQIPAPFSGFFNDPFWYYKNPSNPSQASQVPKPFNGESQNTDTMNNVSKKLGQHTIEPKQPAVDCDTSTAAPGNTVYYKTTEPPKRSLSGSAGFNFGPVNFRHEINREGTSVTTTSRKTW